MSKRISPAEFLAKELEMGIAPTNPRFVANCEKTAIKFGEALEALGVDLSAKTAIDFGAGTGVYADAFQRKGYDIKAFDIWKDHRDFMKESYPELTVIAKTEEADLMLFIEVAEHMTDEQIIKAIEKIKPEFILFSSTSAKTDYDEEWGHINIKSQPNWVKFWKTGGYNKVKDLVRPTKWSMLLRRI